MNPIYLNSNCIIDFDPVFERLNEELSITGHSLELVCAGGYVMQRYGYKATADVDAFYTSTAAIEAIIRKVGDEFGINRPDELWLNNSIARFNPEPSSKHYKLALSFSNLIVNEVDITYLIGMKLISGREQDMVDIGTILEQDNNQDPFRLFSELIEMNFSIDISGLLDAYEKAHGMNWLDKFYQNNQDELRRFF